ncbi:unnamed protein product (macronuclear) [Paramecium tetraurelia]|uniref:Uncharacterized protein n=1 Tax=Paramecium tetraurelia TaxID=5888 RepID=A0CNA0_PARTE|nr:uncharacterized protein GSPATT00008708001 [Paramecium tetraurelia]CAK72267.1 unnamed protein product [Paramecium tetraurelia]|eukprot:XP_001439664.1 hypothetical protein (macronuclear) [Paramecium tetraurelia strain d4-2]
MNLKPPSETGSVDDISDKEKINTLKKGVIELREEKSQLMKYITELTLKNNWLIKEKEGTEQKSNIGDESKQIPKLKQQIFLILQENQPLPFRIMKLAFYFTNSLLGYGKRKLIKGSVKNTALNNQLQKNIEDIERDLYNKIKDLKAEKIEIQLQLKTLDKEMQQRDDELRVIHKGLDDSRFTVAQLQGELEESRGKFIQYKLILHNQLLDIECLFIFRQNLFNEYIFELETAAQKFQYKASEITDLKIKDESSFTLSIKSRNREEVFVIMHNQDLKRSANLLKTFYQKQKILNQLVAYSSIKSKKQWVLGRTDVHFWKYSIEEWNQYKY